jgi:hypothetical protein
MQASRPQMAGMTQVLETPHAQEGHKAAESN